MSGQEEHDEPRGSPGQGGEARPAPGDRGGSLRRGLIVAGALALWLGLGLLVACVVTYTDLIYSHCPSREDYTRAKIHTIDFALVDYKDRHGDYPPSLEELTVPAGGKGPFLDRDYLKDEWGEPFRYDPEDRHPTTGRPKVFAVSPEGKVISNW